MTSAEIAERIARLIARAPAGGPFHDSQVGPVQVSPLTEDASFGCVVENKHVVVSVRIV